MKFWDSSALTPLLVAESRSNDMLVMIAADFNVVIWALTPVEIASALWRRYRETRDERARNDAEQLLSDLAATWFEIDDIASVTRIARQMLSVHALKAADALQLAAAITAANGDAASLPFVTIDEQLAAAARAEGFPVLP